MSSLPRTLQDPVSKVDKTTAYKRIAVEEAWAPPDLFDRYLKMVEAGTPNDPGFLTQFGFYLKSPSKRSEQIREYITDLGAQRIANMDERGIDMQVLALTSPGVQVMTAEDATAYAIYANDMLAEGCRKHPDRFAGLCTVAPHAPAAAAKEIERAVTKLGLKGIMINSHTHGEYMSDQKFWPIFEAAEAHDVPIYLHPQPPSSRMIEPFLEAGLDGAIFGFAIETSLHMIRIITSGAFDRFPKLQFVLGHLGEALPFWMYRLDYMHRAGVVAQRYESMKPIKRKVSDYIRDNITVSTSGVAWDPGIRFCIEVLGEDKVMYAMDYPYQHGAEEVVANDNVQISDAAKKKLFQTNAERVFKIKA